MNYTSLVKSDEECKGEGRTPSLAKWAKPKAKGVMQLRMQGIMKHEVGGSKAIESKIKALSEREARGSKATE